jgi:hypothetical protein
VYPAEKNDRIHRLVRERWNIEETLTALKTAARQLLRARASLYRISELAIQLRAALRIKDELDRQLAESHCTVQFVYPL